MADEPLVSLIMPVWQPRRDWLIAAVRTALESAAEGEAELIVVDDGCPEPVARLLEEIDHPRLRMLRVEHGGPSHARNAGIAEARGSMLRFVDADDVFEPASTTRLVGVIGGADDVIAYGKTVFCDEELRPVWTMASRLEGSISVKAMLSRFTVRTPSLLFPRRVVDAAGPWDPAFPVCGDLDFIVRATEHARVRPDHAVASYYRKHGVSVSSDIVRGDQGIARMIERYFERHPELRGTRLERRAGAARHAVSARAHATRGMLGSAFRQLGSSLALDPRAAPVEVSLALPAAWGHVRYAIASRIR